MISDVYRGILEFFRGAETIKSILGARSEKMARRAIVHFAIELETLHSQVGLLLRYFDETDDPAFKSVIGNYVREGQIKQLVKDILVSHRQVAEYFFADGDKFVVDALAPFAEKLKETGYLALMQSDYVFYNSNFDAIDTYENGTDLFQIGDFAHLQAANKALASTVANLNEYVTSSFSVEEIFEFAKSLHERNRKSDGVSAARNQLENWQDRKAEVRKSASKDALEYWEKNKQKR